MSLLFSDAAQEAAWDGSLHPRSRTGEFATKIAALKHGKRVELDRGVYVERENDKFRIGEPGTRPPARHFSNHRVVAAEAEDLIERRRKDAERHAGRVFARESDVQESAHMVAMHFDPSLHPRDRKGEFMDVLGRLTHGREITLPGGVTVKPGLLGHGHFRVIEPGGGSHAHSVEDAAVKGLAAHDRHGKLTVLARFSPGGERAAEHPFQVGDVVSAHIEPRAKPHIMDLGKPVLSGQHSGLRVVSTHPDAYEVTVQHSDGRQYRIPANHARLETPAGYVDRALDRLSDSRRAVGAPTKRVSKAQAMVDSGLADDLADARAQLADMGELAGMRSPGGERESRGGGRGPLTGGNARLIDELLSPGPNFGERHAGDTGPVRAGDVLYKGTPSPTGFGEVNEPLLTGARLPVLQQIVERHQAQEIDGMLVDATTASLLLKVHDALSPANRALFDTKPLPALVDFAWSVVR